MTAAEDPRSRFATRLRIARRRAALSQAELGARIHVAPSHIAHFESGRRLPCYEHLRALCVVLGVSGDYLLGIKNALTESTMLRDTAPKESE